MMLRVVSSAGTSRAGTLRWQVRTPNPDHETRPARRSAAHRTPPHPGGRPDSRRPFRQHRNRPTYNEKTAVSPGAIPECEHPRDWVAERAVSSEPVSPRFWTSARRLLHPRLFPREHKAESSRWLPASQGRRLPGAPDNHVARADADPNTPALCARPSQWDLDTPLAPQVTLTTNGSWSQPRGIHNAVARSP